MTRAYTIDGHRFERAMLHVPARGPWFCDVDVEGAPDVSGRVRLQLGELVLEGTVDEGGVFARQRRVRVVAGGGGWSTLLTPKAYHNDAGVRARTVAEDAARAAGEELGSFDPTSERVGVDYVRQTGPAARVLEDVIGVASWWVDYDGVTQVGAREAVEVAADTYEVLDHDPRAHALRIAADDPGVIRVGSVLTERLEAAETVRELTVTVSPEAVELRAWTGGEGIRGRLQRAFRELVRRHTDDRLFGLWRYRVVQMSGDRVELQAVRQQVGLPNVLPVSMWPGVAGAHAELAPGAEVLVQFIEGDRTQPIVTHFAGKAGPGWSPANLLLDASTRIDLGAGAESFVALATATDDRLSALQSAHDSHIHVTTATEGSGPTVGTISPTADPVGPLESVAASKVKAE